MNSSMSGVVAWTGKGTFPPFLNISVSETTVRIYARSKEALDNDGVSPGSTAVVELPVAEFRRIAHEMLWRTDPSSARSCDEAKCAKPDKYCRMGGCEYAEHGLPPCKVWEADRGR